MFDQASGIRTGFTDRAEFGLIEVSDEVRFVICTHLRPKLIYE